jgi:hypothetical protein
MIAVYDLISEAMPHSMGTVYIAWEAASFGTS